MVTIVITHPDAMKTLEERILSQRGVVLSFALGTENDDSLIPIMQRMKECMVPMSCTLNMENPVIALTSFLNAVGLVNEVQLGSISTNSILKYGLGCYKRVVSKIEDIASRHSVSVVDVTPLTANATVCDGNNI